MEICIHILCVCVCVSYIIHHTSIRIIGRLPIELDMHEVPKDVFKHDNAPHPPVQTRSPTFTEVDTDPGSSKTLPPLSPNA